MRSLTLLFSTLVLSGLLHGQALNREEILKDVKIISADSLHGREVSTPGNDRARRYLIKRFKELGIQKFGESYEQPFEFEEGVEFISAVNVVGFLPGKSSKAIVITAHYDHLGVRDGYIYNGADDNASGVAGMLACARAYGQTEPDHTLIFAAFDAEERGLQGAKEFISAPVVPLEDIVFNINLDMISRNDNNEIYAAGGYHYQIVKELIEEVRKSSKVKISLGHDSPDLGHNDWTNSSDHGPFHEKGIPFIYYGVEDHPDYHQPSDEFQNINQDFFIDVVAMVVETVRVVDRSLE